MVAEEMRWYCLRAITGKELKVKEVLEAEIAAGGFDGCLQQVIVPTENVVSQKGNKKVVKEKVLFSGYVFVRCQLTPEVLNELEATTHVVNILRGRTTNKPEALPDEQIVAMLGSVDSKSESAGEDALSFMVGEVIKVDDGPFKDFEGVIEEVNDEKKKLKVMVKIFGRKTPLELDYTQVVK